MSVYPTCHESRRLDQIRVARYLARTRDVGDLRELNLITANCSGPSSSKWDKPLPPIDATPRGWTRVMNLAGRDHYVVMRGDDALFVAECDNGGFAWRWIRATPPHSPWFVGIYGDLPRDAAMGQAADAWKRDIVNTDEIIARYLRRLRAVRVGSAEMRSLWKDSGR